MEKTTPLLPPEAEELIRSVGQRAFDLFDSRAMLCSEAVLTAVNEALHGGLDQTQAVALASGLPNGFGGTGCLCGALSGGALALGLVLAPRQSRRDIRAVSGQLHHDFTKAHGSSCCRVLSRKFKDDKDAHFANCSRLTRSGAEMAMRRILIAAPDLVASTAGQVSPPRPKALPTLLRRLADLLS